MDLQLKGKTALVLAASKGLGKACAGMLAREGANVVIGARNRDTLEAAAAEIREQPVCAERRIFRVEVLIGQRRRLRRIEVRDPGRAFERPVAWAG